MGINGWSEALRVELQPDVRVIVIEPGATATELPDHITHAASKRVSKALDWSIPPHDIADVIAFAVSRPQRVTLNEILVHPTVQAMGAETWRRSLDARRRTDEFPPRARRPRHQRSLVSSLAIRTIAMGLGFGDRFGGFQGRSGPLEEMVPHAKKAGELQGKRLTKRLLGIA